MQNKPNHFSENAFEKRDMRFRYNTGEDPATSRLSSSTYIYVKDPRNDVRERADTNIVCRRSDIRLVVSPCRGKFPDVVLCNQ